MGGPFLMGERVRKKSGAAWQGRIVGWYSTALTPRGYAVESEFHPGSVQIYPESALERIIGTGGLRNKLVALAGCTAAVKPEKRTDFE